ncbi:MAG: diguanylate cyclase, partial [Campylobacterales bacterium]|nr:diguanylate cyclase [Campylobacterales bacterium]
MKRLKRSILLFLSLLVLIVAAAIALYTIMHEKEMHAQRIDEVRENVLRNYRESIDQTVRFYTARAYANLSSPGVIEAIIAQDRERLFDLIAKRWGVMQEENEALFVMQFHNADGTSLLRMHQKNVHSDPIADARKMVRDTHRQQSIIHGFEEGRAGLGFRLLVPIIHEKRYLGALEFGLHARHLLGIIRRHTGYDAFFWLQERYVGFLDTTRRSIQIGDMIAFDPPKTYLDAIEHYKEQHQSLEESTLQFNDQTLYISLLPIENHAQETIGSVMLLYPAEDLSLYVRQMLLAACTIALLFILLLWLAIRYFYDVITQRIRFEERYNQALLDSIPSPVIATDGEHLLAANLALLDFLGYPTLQAFVKEHQCVCDYFEEGDTDEYLLPIKENRRWTQYIIDFPNRIHKAKITQNGVTSVFDVKLSTLIEGGNTRYVVVFNDISAMQTRALTDTTTGIANRLHFTMMYSHLCTHALRNQKPLSLILFDIDHFKQINDTYGHLIGD